MCVLHALPADSCDTCPQYGRNPLLHDFANRTAFGIYLATILKVLVMAPLNMPMPVMVTFALPTFLLFE